MCSVGKETQLLLSFLTIFFYSVVSSYKGLYRVSTYNFASKKKGSVFLQNKTSFRSSESNF